MKIQDLCQSLEMKENLGNPIFDSSPRTTSGGSSYLVKPGVAMILRPMFNLAAMEGFINGFDRELGFRQYLSDPPIRDDRGNIQEGAGVIKTAGQLCYMSLGEKRTKNAEAGKYLDHIKSSGHGSVLEHAQYTFLVYGASRSFTHELVRHRTGVAFSQVSQRYVDGKVLRFVERPEYQNDPELHARFEKRIDFLAKEYAEVATILVDRQKQGSEILSGDRATDMRKKVNQAARSGLPNETEAPVVFSGNIRALRHVCEMRASGPADIEIRAVLLRIFLAMATIEPHLFSDYNIVDLPDGTHAVETKYRKV